MGMFAPPIDSFGGQTKLPKHYVARQKLCLRATVDYWVNAMDGQPFFLINKEVDPGLLKVLEDEIVPRLEGMVPNQPSQERQASDPLLHRFTLIFDREGYSPEIFLRMRDKHIACLTYHKYPGDKWPEEEFVSHQVKLASGNEEEMKIAERGKFMGKKVWVREIRKQTKSGHQTAILSTDYRSDLTVVSAAMFARWSQENFLKYMRQHYNIDRLIDYSIEEIPETTVVVNPKYRSLDTDVRRKAGILNRCRAKFCAIALTGEIEPKPVLVKTGKRIEAHIFVSFLAYCLHTTLRNLARRRAAGLTSDAILKKLSSIQMIDIHLPTTDGRHIVMSRYTQTDKDVSLLLAQTLSS